MAKIKEEKEQEKVKLLTPEQVLENHQNDNPTDHLNSIDGVYYRVSTGSLIWDAQTFGLTPGLHRFMGPPESGKTSAALEVCRNFLAGNFYNDTSGAAKNPKRRGLYIKAEGRLSEEMMARSGLKFVFKAKEWKDGTIYVVESNIYEYVLNLLRALVKGENAGDTLYCIIIDSTDAMILKADDAKRIDEESRVAGTPKLTKRFLQSVAMDMAKRGHVCLMLSQYSSSIELDKYADAQNKKPQQGSGGWGAAHFANFAFEFLTTFKNRLILADKNIKTISVKNPIVGKYIGIKFKKSPNEKTGMEFEYPVKHGVTGGSSVWTAREIADMLLMYQCVTGGTMFNVTKRGFDAWKKLGILDADDVLEKCKWKGEEKFVNWVAEDAARQKLLYGYCLELIKTQQLAVEATPAGPPADEF